MANGANKECKTILIGSAVLAIRTSNGYRRSESDCASVESSLGGEPFSFFVKATFCPFKMSKLKVENGPQKPRRHSTWKISDYAPLTVLLLILLVGSRFLTSRIILQDYEQGFRMPRPAISDVTVKTAPVTEVRLSRKQYLAELRRLPATYRSVS